MTVRQMQKVLEADDFADTRTWDLAHAAEVLHRACCPLDSWNLEMFTKRYGGPLGIFKFMEDYSGTEMVRETSTPLRIVPSVWIKRLRIWIKRLRIWISIRQLSFLNKKMRISRRQLSLLNKRMRIWKQRLRIFD